MSSPTEKQIACLEKFGVDASDMDFNEASAAIDEIAANGWKKPGAKSAKKPGKPAPKKAPPKKPAKKASGPTPKMCEILEKFGYDTDCTFEEARDVLDRLKANNWKPLEDDDETGFE